MVSRARAAAAAMVLLALALTGCSALGTDRAGIVVTTNILGDVTRAIVGTGSEVTVLMKPGADPHSFGVSAQEAARMEKAALLIHNGLGLEEGVARNVETARASGVPTVNVGEGVGPLAYTAGENARQPDPHFWTDPGRMLKAVDLIAARIVAYVPEADAAKIRANAMAYRARVAELDRWMGTRFAALPAGRRKLVTNHHVFGYLADRFRFTVIGAVVPGGTTLASPSGADLKSLADAVRRAGVPTVFADSSQPDRLVRVMAAETGLRIRVASLHSESLTPADGDAPPTCE